MATRKGVWAALALFVLLSACADSPQFVAKKEQIEQTRPICESGKDCDAKWKAVRGWVIDNAGFYIWKENSESIETSIGGDNDERPIVRVTKEPIGEGKYKIVVAISCTNFYGCVPNKWNEELAFNRAIGAVTP